MSQVIADCGHTTGDTLPLCSPCTAKLTKDLRAVPGVIADLAVAAARQDRMTNGRLGGRSTETALPMRPAIARHLHALDNTLSTWARVVADHATLTIDTDALRHQVLTERNETYQRTTPDRLSNGVIVPGTTITVLRHPAELSLLPVTTAEISALWLARHPHALRALPAAIEAHDDITDALATARLAVDRRDLVFAGPCRSCRHDLYIERGVDTVQCSRCGQTYDARDLGRLLLGQVSDTLVTREEALGAVQAYRGQRIPDSTWRTWRSRGQLKPRAWDHDGRITDHYLDRRDPPLFRLGDVLTLLSAKTPTPRRTIRRHTRQGATP